MNLKGGTAKTVTAINTAAILARDHAQRVLLVDADSQANLTEFVTDSTMPDGVTPGGFSDLLRGLTGFPIPTKMRNVSLLFASPELMELDVTAAGSGTADPMALADFLAEQREKYDWCIIDCPPAFSAAAMAALIAADEVVIPMKLDAFGIRGMRNLMSQIRNMQKINRGLEVAGVLPTMFYAESGQQAAVEADLQKSLALAGIRCFRHIRRSSRVDGMTFAQDALIYSSPKSKATHDYKFFVHELVQLAEGGDHDGV